MTTEPQRLQYLEAMGLTAWVARFQLPHARPTEACEWELPERLVASPPAERLHALLDEAGSVARQAPPAESAAEPPRATSPGRARQLLGITPSHEEAQQPVGEEATPTETRPVREPLRFVLQVGCLGGRWLVIVPQETAPDAIQSLLLDNLLKAAAIDIEQPPAFEAYRWPPMENLPAEAPLEEAREGLQAFVEGTRRRGWSPERVLVFGRDDTLDRLLDMREGQAELLGLPGWQGPALAELVQSAAAKRALWPTLLEWRRAWSQQESKVDG